MLDRITVSVVQDRREAVVREMGESMLRIASSQVLNSRHACSTLD